MGTCTPFGTMLNKSHILPLRVYFADTDAANIVYHGRFVEFMERGRSEFLTSLGCQPGNMKEHFGCVWVISELQIKYQRPGFVDDVLEVITQIKELKLATVTMRQIVQRVENDQRIPLTQAHVRLAVMDPTSGKPKRFDPTLREKLITTLS